MQLIVLFTGILSQSQTFIAAAGSTAHLHWLKMLPVYYIVNLWPLQLFVLSFVSFRPSAQTEETATE